MRGTQTYDTLVFVTEHCCNCGIAFGIEQSHQRRLRESGAWFYCPSGHTQHYTETEIQRLQKKLTAAEEEAASARLRAESWKSTSDHQARRLVALRGHQTRLKKRIAAGKCPCCHEEFKDVAKHIAAQHPGFADSVPS